MIVSTEDSAIIEKIQDELPVIPINDGVVFPYMLVPLILTDKNLVRLIDEALAGNKIVGVFTQRDSSVSEPGPDDLYKIGCAMIVQKKAKFPDGHVRIIGQGLARIEIGRFTDDIPFMRAQVSVITEPDEITDRSLAVASNVINAFSDLVDRSESYPDDLRIAAAGIKVPGRLADLLAANVDMEISEKQRALEMDDPADRLDLIYQCINRELKIASLGEKIRADVHREMDREQKEYYLRQQIRAMQRELGDEDDAVELDELRDRIDCTVMPEHAREASMREWNRISRMNPNSSEYNVSRTYLDWLLDLPWESCTDDMLDLAEAEKILDRDHFDLEEVKERILEFLAVRKLKDGVKGSIICFTGPPGVGKTSLGRSIASALGREFIRVSLGGVRDEAEIRGHRRTYIGALPGRIIQGIKTAGSRNPVFMLDEIDKLGNDFKGDPSSALLEVLDPEQNCAFADHYIGIPFDLSKVMFITTANIRETIPAPLLDRMEVIEIAGYITGEKLEIARRFLIPKQLEDNGIDGRKAEITPEAIRCIIEQYTREAGVRTLERKIANVARKVARKLVEGKRGPYRITPRNLKNYLGPVEYPDQEMLPRPETGVATGMAKTTSGGTILFVESLGIRGNGKVKLTGQIGDVMRESAEAAMSFVRSHLTEDEAGGNFFENHDIHLHIPAGAVPKDGPSAGVAIAVSLASLVTGRKVRNDTAMTGEITLTGKVLPVGAVKEKVIAAHRAGVRNIILPALNRNDLVKIPENIGGEIEFIFIDKVEEGISAALLEDGRAGAATRKRTRGEKGKG